MWGNRQGWTVSFAIIVFTGVFLYVIAIASELTAPTKLSTNPDNLTRLAAPVPTAVVDFNENGDAGEIYRACIASMADHSGATQAYVGDPSGPVPQPLTLLMTATHKKSMTLFEASPAEVINYDSQRPALDSLNLLGQTANLIGLARHAKHQDAEARKYYEAAYSLGVKLYDERLVHDEYADGMSLMEDALHGLSEMQKPGSGQKESLNASYEALLAYNTDHVQPMYQAIANINASQIAIHAGDIFNFALNSEDRMIRVEAILNLGRIRFAMGARNADQLGAERYARQFATDADPIISTAGKAARDMTVEQFRAYTQ